MPEKKELNVNEESLMRIMAADMPTYDKHKKQPAVVVNPETKNTEPQPVHEEIVSPATETVETVKPADETVKPAKRKNVRQIDFEGTFLKEAKIKDRRQMYISGDYYDKISAYLRIISDGKVSMVGYIHNVLSHHILEYKDMINEMYKDKLNRINPL